MTKSGIEVPIARSTVARARTTRPIRKGMRREGMRSASQPRGAVGLGC